MTQPSAYLQAITCAGPSTLNTWPSSLSSNVNSQDSSDCPILSVTSSHDAHPILFFRVLLLTDMFTYLSTQ